MPENNTLDYAAMLAVAIEEARTGLSEGGIPLGAAIFRGDGTLVSQGHNRRVQQDDPSIHGETDAFRRAGRQRSYRHITMVTTLAPCWYCTGLIRQFAIPRVIVGEAETGVQAVQKYQQLKPDLEAVVSLPDGRTLALGSGATPAPCSCSVTIVATDGAGFSGTASFAWTVTFRVPGVANIVVVAGPSVVLSTVPSPSRSQS